MADQGWRGSVTRCRGAAPIAGFALLVVLSAVGADARANDPTDIPMIRNLGRSEYDPAYSYYYVPRLAELNQFVGALFRSGHVRVNASGPAVLVKRYAAYSCEGALMLDGDDRDGRPLTVDWSTVAGLRTGGPGERDALVVDRPGTAAIPASPLVLHVDDPAIRYRLHQMLAVLMSECRSKTAASPGHSVPRATG